MNQSGHIVADRVTKSFGGSRAVDGVSLQFARGEIVGIAGSNGAGKSTLGRLLSGFLAPDAGSARVGGVESGRHRSTAGVGYMPEETARDWGSAQVGDLLILIAKPNEDVTANPVIVGLGLLPLLNRKISLLSKGQWRLALAAAALVREPALVVLDEPDAGLDPLALERLSTVIRQVASRGSAVLILSHHLDEMSRLADRIIFMRAGRLVEEMRRESVGFPSLRERFTACMSGVS